MASDPEVAAPVKEGEILDAKYRIEEVIGVGGMGIVVAAHHLELDWRVALKFLLPQAAQSEELVRRFVREAKASVKLKGQHVAEVLDVGRLDDSRAYIVMEYLDGRDLGVEIAGAEEPFAIEDAVTWVLQACEGLAEAHAHGIIHRDLKPGNLFLTCVGEGKRVVKLLDFGISKSINPTASEVLSLTKTEMLLGSPLYMAPEQLRSSKDADERSDIWSLGAIAYELLSGHVPFEATTLLDLCFKVVQEVCRDVRELRPEISPELASVVMRCLEKDPEARWSDIGALAAALEPFASPASEGSADRTIAVLARSVDVRVRKDRSAKGGPASARAAVGGDGSGDPARGATNGEGAPSSRSGVPSSGSPVVTVDEAPASSVGEPGVLGMAITARVDVPVVRAKGGVAETPDPRADGGGSARATHGKGSRESKDSQGSKGSQRSPEGSSDSDSGALAPNVSAVDDASRGREVAGSSRLGVIVVAVLLGVAVLVFAATRGAGGDAKPAPVPKATAPEHG